MQEAEAAHGRVATLNLKYDLEHGENVQDTVFLDMDNGSSLELLAIEIDGRPGKIVCFN